MTGLTPRGRWAIAVIAACLWAATRATAGNEVVNVGGWPSFARFWESVTSPDLSAAFLRITWNATLTTAAYAVLGTVVSVGVGLAAAPVVSARVWESADRRPISTWLRRGTRGLARLALVVPRAVHEVIWALLLVQVLGFDPLVAIIAIGIQFGAVTAKVYGEFVDEADPHAFRALRGAGAGRLRGLLYGIVPAIRRDLVSYGFYRLECAVRSAAVLGIIGAGGLGFQLDLSFESLKYDQIWTLIIALMILSGLADSWSSLIRHRSSRRVVRASWLALVVAVPLASRQVGLDISTLWSERTRRLARQLIGELFPPRLGPGGWSELISASVDTVAMSILATAIAVAGGLLLAFLAARPSTRSSLPRRVGGSAARLVLLLFRAVPAPAWAFLFVLILFPGIWPGAVALGVYNLGVLGRLFAEVVEDHDERARCHLASSGAGAIKQFAYAVLPSIASRLTGLALYRWEVVTRETVIVGVVGAAGLGRLIREDLVARDFAAVTGTIGALVVLTALIDITSSRMRAALR
jgi:phosphonate transport system permease protein